MAHHVVVDGSNIATEGRPLPSLKQLNEAVLAYMEEHPEALVTVVVDATFGHRIANNEVAEFDEAIANNELVSPPAGAVGRGDAFVLSIAKKAHATILSNDSFQEFHGEHPWLFDVDRLVGGKPVPHVGWVFVARNPVRGPISRRAVKDTKAPRKSSGHSAEPAAAGRPSALASEPMPVPSSPPPGRRGSSRSDGAAKGRGAEKAARAAAPEAASGEAVPVPGGQAPIPAKGSFINDLMPFLSFVEQHPVGSHVEITIDAYASHGAYATSGDARCYLPLRYMAEPAPRAARDVVKLGETHDVVVVSFNPARRGIDVAMPAAVPAGLPLVPAPAAAGAASKGERKPRGRKAAAPTGGEPTAVVVASTDEPAGIDPAESAGGNRPLKRPSKRKAAAAPSAAPAPSAETAESPTPEPAALGRPTKSAPKARRRTTPTTTEPATVPAAANEPEPAAGPAATTRGRARAKAPAVEAAEPKTRKRAGTRAAAGGARTPAGDTPADSPPSVDGTPRTVVAPATALPAVAAPAVAAPAVALPAVAERPGAGRRAGAKAAAKQAAPRLNTPDAGGARTKAASKRAPKRPAEVIEPVSDRARARRGNRALAAPVAATEPAAAVATAGRRRAATKTASAARAGGSDAAGASGVKPLRAKKA